jgi:hypothetical protein
LLLFTPDAFVIKHSLAEFKKEYSKYIGVAFLGSFAWIVITLGSWIISKISRWYETRKNDNRLRETLKNLNGSELQVLNHFIERKQSTLELAVNSPEVASLISKGFLYQVGKFGQPLQGYILWNCSINPRVESVLREKN